MATLAQARTRWVSENPIGSPGYVLTQADYDALADNRAPIMLSIMNQEEAAAAAELDKQQFVNGMTALRADLTAVQTAITTNTPLTAGQVRVGFRDILTSLIWLGDHIADGTILTRQ